MHREAVDDGFNRLAAATPWQEVGHYSNPVVRVADGQPYWVTASFDANARHDDAEGRPNLPADNSAYLGRSLFTDFLLPVELGGVLLLVATVGAIAIAQRRTTTARAS